MSEAKLRRLAAAKLLVLAQETIISSMQKAGLNRNQLSKKMGCSRSAITRLLNGDTLITIGTLALALECCGLEIARFELTER